jgi:hypothetical protein
LPKKRRKGSVKKTLRKNRDFKMKRISWKKRRKSKLKRMLKSKKPLRKQPN